MNVPLIKKLITCFLLVTFLSSCGIYKYSPARENPVRGTDRAKKNVAEGRGVNLGDLARGGRAGTNYEFSSSNPMWRASLEILDFIPLTTVDYSGGMIISDWYSEGAQANESIKITIRFLSNEIRSDSIKVIVHEKNCNASKNCKVSLLAQSKINEELRSSILKKAALIKIDQNKKKK